MAAVCCQICAAPCKLLGKCCWGMEQCCAKACGCICGCVAGDDRPSPIFLTYTLVFNIPIAAVAIYTGLRGQQNECDMFIPPAAWAFILAGCSAFFCIFAIRVYMLFARPYSYSDDAISRAEQGTPAVQKNKRDTFSRRLKYEICHDPFMFIYFFVYPFAFVWVTMGLADVKSFEGCRTVSVLLWVVSAAMYIYLVGTILVTTISCCYEGSRAREAKHQQGQQAMNPSEAAAHMFAPSFGNHQPAAATAPPYVQQAPPVQHMGTPGTSGPPPVGKATGNETDASIFGKMKHAFTGA